MTGDYDIRLVRMGEKHWLYDSQNKNNIEDYVKKQVRELYNEHVAGAANRLTDKHSNDYHADALRSLVRWSFGGVVGKELWWSVVNYEEETFLKHLAWSSIFKPASISHPCEWLFWIEFSRKILGLKIPQKKIKGTLRTREITFWGARKRYVLDCVYSSDSPHDLELELIEVFDSIRSEFPSVFKTLDLSVEIVEVIPELEIKPELALAAAR